MVVTPRILASAAFCGALAAGLLAGCGADTTPNGGDTCGVTGATQTCVCDNGLNGAQTCAADGTWSACACGSAGDTGVDTTPGEDTGVDTTPGEDTGVDTTPGEDTDLDTTTDTAADTGVDTTTDVGTDTTTDVGTDTTADVGTDTTTDVGTGLAAGEACAADAECASEICLEIDADTSLCSEECDTECSVDGWVCFAGLCVPDDWCGDEGGVPVGPGCDTDCVGGCDVNAACVNDAGAFVCVCNAGFDGDGTTCTDVNECTLGTDDCDVRATCTNRPGGYECACNSGWTGDGTSCADENECTLGTAGCDANATCDNLPGDFACRCNDGWSGDGFTCGDVNECTGANDCSVNATCANTPGSYTCTCDTGFEGDGFTCTDIDECTLGTDTCTVDEFCVNTPGGFTCSGCPAGYEPYGPDCVNVDECARGTDVCDVNATCADTDGSYTCTCDAGFSGDGFTCTEDSICADGSPVSGECDGNTLSACDPDTAESFSVDCAASWGGIGGVCGEYVDGELTCVVQPGDQCLADFGDGNVILPCAGVTPSCEFTVDTGWACGDGTRGTCTADDVDGCIGDLLVRACLVADGLPAGIDCGAVGGTCNATEALCDNVPAGGLCATGIVECAPGLACVGETATTDGVCTATDVNECTAGTAECDPNATCTDLAEGYDCTCNAGYSGDGFTCTLDSGNPCLDGTIPADGTCSGDTLQFCDDTNALQEVDCVAFWLDDGACGFRADGVADCLVVDGGGCLYNDGAGGLLFPQCETDGRACTIDPDTGGYTCSPGDPCTTDLEGACNGSIVVQACVDGQSYGPDCTDFGGACSAGACVGVTAGNLCASGLLECAFGLTCVGESATAYGVCE